MTFLATLQQKVGFTHREALAVLILSGTFLVGIGIRWIRSIQQQEATTVPSFDYSRSDSAFAARSKPPEKVTGLNVTPAPAGTEAGVVSPSKSKTAVTGKGVNINTATKAQLINLPGIGPSLADRILEYRASNGSFKSVDDLRRVKGIGEKKFEKIRPLVWSN